MNAIGWIFVISLLIFIILAGIGLKYPMPRLQWPFDKNQTLKLLVGVVVFTIFLVLLNILKKRMDLPSREKIVFFGSMILFGILAIIGIFLPEGIRRGSDRDGED